jgi:HSP20 family protein
MRHAHAAAGNAPEEDLAVTDASAPTTTPATKTPAATRSPMLYPFHALRDEMDRLFDDFVSGLPLPFGRRRADVEPLRRLPLFGAALPAVEVAEDDKGYHITAELPGLDEKDIEVAVVDDLLTIKGEKKQEQESKADNYHYSERHYGRFERAMRLPDDVDRTKIDASFKNGVLTLALPKNPQATPKTQRIAVKTA